MGFGEHEGKVAVGGGGEELEAAEEVVALLEGFYWVGRGGCFLAGRQRGVCGDGLGVLHVAASRTLGHPLRGDPVVGAGCETAVDFVKGVACWETAGLMLEEAGGAAGHGDGAGVDC